MTTVAATTMVEAVRMVDLVGIAVAAAEIAVVVAATVVEITVDTVTDYSHLAHEVEKVAAA